MFSSRTAFVWAIVIILAVAGSAFAGPKADCATIPEGGLQTTDGQFILSGFDQWGYNYGAHLFNGEYCDVYRNAAWCQAYRGVSLSMKWNEEWLASSDCDGDGLLDRHRGFATYRGSGAWTTNHMSGKDSGGRRWVYFVKIVAAPEDARLQGGVWYAPNGKAIGYAIWGEFAVLLEVENDPTTGNHGQTYKSAVAPGFGRW